jgi:hypothetical protein
MKVSNKLTIIFFLFTIILNAQINTRNGGVTNVLPNNPTTNTNVGIGTNTPRSKLDVEGGISIGVSYSGSNVSPTNGAIIEGNVGIGTVLPTSKLDVNGMIKGVGGSFPKSVLSSEVFPTNNDRLKACNVLSAGSVVDSWDGKTFNFLDIPSSSTNPNNTIWFSLQNRNDVARFVFSATQNSSSNLRVLNKLEEDVFKITDDGADNVSLLLPKSNSFLGIGTSSFTDGVDTFKLSVAGNIRANRVKVYTTWADYVFEEGYNLPTINEVEKFISKNGHLKDIPSAESVEKNGIDLGEMNKLLLQKIEELTLYIIDLNREVENLKQTIKK